MKKKPFPLQSEPADFQISVHIQNLFTTFGEEKVRQSMKELFGMTTRKIKKESANEDRRSNRAVSR